MLKVLDEIGGEPLEGSGFEAERPEPGFSENEIPVESRPSPA